MTMRRALRVFSVSALMFAPFAMAHPGWGIGVDDHSRIIVGDVMQSVIWRFEEGHPPERLASDLHAHWLIVAPNGDITAEHLRYDPRNESFHKSIKRLSAGAGAGAAPRTLLSEADGGDAFSFNAFAIRADGAIALAPDSSPGEIRLRFPDGRTNLLATITAPTPADLSHDAAGIQRKGPIVSAMLFTPDNTLYANTGYAIYRIEHIPPTAPAIAIPELLFRAPQIIDDITLANPPVDSNDLWGLAIAGDGAIYTTQPRVRRVLRWALADAAPTVVFHVDPPWYPSGIAAHADSIYILEHALQDNHNLGPRVVRLDKDNHTTLISEIK